MNEPASSKIATGGLVLLIGLGVTAASMAASARGGVVIVAWGAMLFGAVRLVSGLLHLGPSSAADDIINDVTEEVRVLVAIMSAMILDPQMPTSEELAVIRAALNDASAAFGYVVRPFDNAVIREAALAMQTEPEGIAGYVRKKRKYLNDNAKKFIAKSALAVLLARREPPDAEAPFMAVADAMAVGEDEARSLLVSSKNARDETAAAADAAMA